MGAQTENRTRVAALCFRPEKREPSFIRDRCREGRGRKIGWVSLALKLSLFDPAATLQAAA